MLCHVQELCQKIIKGVYNTPAYISSEVKDLLARMLTVVPDHRITFEQVHSLYMYAHMIYHESSFCSSAADMGIHVKGAAVSNIQCLAALLAKAPSGIYYSSIFASCWLLCMLWYYTHPTIL